MSGGAADGPGEARLVFGAGGVGAEAVGNLYAAVSAALGVPGEGPGEGRRPVLVMAASAGAFADARGRVTQPLDGVDVVIATSGSTDGQGHLVGLGWSALLASARATLDRLDGPGQWLTSLPVHAVAGFQVVVRSALAGLPPTVYAPASGFDAGQFARAVAGMRSGVPRYLSLVPTQLHRILGADPGLLAGFSAVLVGGAALAPALAARARDAGVRVVATYGMTETCGGCVYDGVPLDGVRVRVADRRIHLGGPVLATRYVDTAAQPFVTDAAGRWLVTGDLGAWEGGRLRVLGRADDVIISGGVNVNPHEVEAALSALGGQWVVVGVPDPEWGRLVVAVTDAAAVAGGGAAVGGPASGPGEAVVSGGAASVAGAPVEGGVPDLASARAATGHLPPAARPRALVRVVSLPTRRTGKLDRRAVAALAASELAAGRAERR